jgi:RsiW-degrading membrane proteinase PrsW (M82 family)
VFRRIKKFFNKRLNKSKIIGFMSNKISNTLLAFITPAVLLHFLFSALLPGLDSDNVDYFVWITAFFAIITISRVTNRVNLERLNLFTKV